MKSVVVVAFAFVSSCAFADQISSDASHTAAIEHYQYSDHLDIKRVIESPDVTSFCGIRPVRMTYEDHDSHIHVMEYEVSGSGCNDN
jgi:hypothetical protein